MWIGGDIIKINSKYIPMMGVIAIFAIAALFCVAPLGASVHDTQQNNDVDVVKAYAATDTVNITVTTTKTNTSTTKTKNTTVSNVTTKTVKKVVKVTKMPKKDYQLMVKSIKKSKKINGVQPARYKWNSESLYIYKKDYTNAIKRFNNWVKTHKGKLPSYVNVYNGVKVTKVVVSPVSSNVSKNTTANKTKIVKTVIDVTQMYNSDYQAMVNYIANYTKLKGSQPSYYNWSSESMLIYKDDYLDAIDRFDKWVKNNNGKLPNYVNIYNAVKLTEINGDVSAKKSTSLPLAGELQGYDGLTKLQNYMNKNLNHRDGGPSTFAGVVAAKVGDCWGLAEWAANQLKVNGYSVRIVQGATSLAYNHRWVQVLMGGKWINFESSLVTKKYGSKHYSKTCASVRTIVKTL